MPDITRALIASARSGNSASLALCFRLHEAYETARWDVVENVIAAGDRSSLHDLELRELLSILLDQPDTP